MSEKTFGEILAEERERQGLTLSEVGSALRIKTDVLLAFETGDFSVMPHKGYSRNLISAYARYLGLDSVSITSQFLSDYRAFSEGAMPQTSTEYYRSSENTSSDKRLAGIGRSGAVRNRKTGEVVETEPYVTKSSRYPMRDQEWNEQERESTPTRRSATSRRAAENPADSRPQRRRVTREESYYEEDEPFSEEYDDYNQRPQRSRMRRTVQEDPEPAPSRRRVASVEEEDYAPAPRRRVRREIIEEDPDEYEEDFLDEYQDEYEDYEAPAPSRRRTRTQPSEDPRSQRPSKVKPHSRSVKDREPAPNRRNADIDSYSRHSGSSGGGGRMPVRFIIIGLVVVFLLVGVVSLVRGMSEDRQANTNNNNNSVENTGIVTDTGSTAKSTDNILGSMSEEAQESIEKVVGPFTLKVVIPEGQETWLDIKVDGVYQVSGTIAGEKSYTFEVQEKCEVGTGNADVGMVYCNGSQVKLENINGMGYVALEIKPPEE